VPVQLPFARVEVQWRGVRLPIVKSACDEYRLCHGRMAGEFDWFLIGLFHVLPLRVLFAHVPGHENELVIPLNQAICASR
jgi:hypothetical protein